MRALKERPTLDFRQAFYYRAFQRCSGSRQVTMGGAGAIPLNQIESYCNLLNIHDVEKREEHIEWIQLLDNAYLKIKAEERENAPKPPKK